MSMKSMRIALVVSALALFGVILAPGVHADDWNKKTVLTFSQPVEIPGQVLPAGTYTFKLANSLSDRHIVQVFNADGTQLITTVLAINNYRLHPTGATVIKFSERAGDSPDAVKAWFYPGDTFGQEFVYPKQRAIQLAMAEKEPIPAIAMDTTPADLTSAPIEAVTPEQKEVPVAEAIAVTPPAAEETAPLVAQNVAPAPMAAAQSLPKTASPVPLIALLGLASLGCAFLVKRFAIRES
jgi:hypothetical protein